MDSNNDKNLKQRSVSKKTLLDDVVDVEQDDAIASYIKELEKRNEQIHASRRAALNALEDAILSREALSLSEEKYRNLFESIDEGFCIIEVLFDKKGDAYDYRFLEFNGSFEKQTGLVNAVGKTIKELAPNHEQHWFDIYGKIAKTGHPERFENAARSIGHYYDVYAFRIGKPNQHLVAILFNDITERKRIEENRTYIQILSDAIRPIADPVSIEESVSRIAMDHFAADRCYYCTIEGNDVIINRDALRGDLPSVAGTYSLNSFVIFRKVIDEGKPLIVNDSHTTDKLDEGLRAICIQLQIISFINVPIIKAGKAVGIFCFVQSTQRNWTDLEVELAIETAERTWAAIERAKAEEALRAIEDKYRKELQLEVQKSTEEIVKLNAELKHLNTITANNFSEALRHVYINLETIVTTDARNLSNSSRANLRRAQAAIQKMKLLSNDINSYLLLYDFKIQKETIYPNNILQNVIEKLQKKIEESNATINIDQLPSLNADPSLFTKLMTEMIGNSIKFHQEDKQPAINIGYCMIDHILDHKLLQQKPFIVITIADEGIGFEKTDSIFEPFTQLHDQGKHKGAGMGLAICKKIMEMHGGFIAVDSTPGDGATFSCYFPS